MQGPQRRRQGGQPVAAAGAHGIEGFLHDRPAAIHHLRDGLNKAGFPKVKIVASSGFEPAKCKMMAEAEAPIDAAGKHVVVVGAVVVGGGTSTAVGAGKIIGTPLGDAEQLNTPFSACRKCGEAGKAEC